MSSSFKRIKTVCKMHLKMNYQIRQKRYTILSVDCIGVGYFFYIVCCQSKLFGYMAYSVEVSLCSIRVASLIYHYLWSFNVTANSYIECEWINFLDLTMDLSQF
jgi:hypothetical protein